MASHDILMFIIRNNLICQIWLKDVKNISFDEKINNSSFKSFYLNLALNLASKLIHVPDKFDLKSVLAHYKKLLNTGNQKLTVLIISEGKILKLLKTTNPEKAFIINSWSWRKLTWRPMISGKRYFGPGLGLLDPNLGHIFFFFFSSVSSIRC